ncbi:hypothetical protein HMI54_009998, partial [Coelomomyces lativittatus]
SLRFFPQHQETLPSSGQSIPNAHVEFGVHDTLRYGFHSVAHQITQKHPLEIHVQKDQEVTQQRQYTLLQKIYGSHLPLRLQMEKHLVSLKPVCPLLPSHHLALSILEGKDETLEIEDFLGMPDQQPTELLDFHTMMEQRSSLS